MNKKAVIQLLITQFLSALADNAILFATLYVIKEKFSGNDADVYTGIVQGSFFVAYILLAPYASVLSEKVPKSNVLWIGNVLKVVGALFLLFGIDPALSYAMVGVGACVYGPGKYSILKELTNNEKDLYKANGWVEGSTIFAILGGTVLGETLTNIDFHLSMYVILGIYALSFVMAWILPKGAVLNNMQFRKAWRTFGKDVHSLLSMKEARSTLIGTGSFWMVSAVIRIAMLAWIPVALHMGDKGNVSLYMAMTAIGIVIGSLVSPYMIPLHKITRISLLGMGMAVSVSLIGWFPNAIFICITLFASGFLGGAYIIPLNTILQEKGSAIGTGKTIAIQNFVQNAMMVIGMLLYTGGLKIGMTIPLILVGFGVLFFVLSLVVRLLFSRLSKTS